MKRSFKEDYKLGYEFAGEAKDITTLDGAVVSGVWIQTSDGIDVSGQAPTIQFDTGFCARSPTVDASGKIGLAYNSGTRYVANVDLWKSGGYKSRMSSRMNVNESSDCEERNMYDAS